ncbi:MAG: endonuclease III, partial [Nanoarchaeota archaeon]
KRVQQASRYLLNQYEGKVPKTLEELLSIPGVGRKVANIILAECFNIPAIAVDIHVFRISQRIGLAKGKTPLEIERQLEKMFQKKEWKNINRVLVVHGQNICGPLLPKCSVCPIERYCEKNNLINLQ